MSADVLAVTPNPCMDRTLTVDQLRVGRLHRVQDSREDPAGKGINVAKALRVLGQDAVLMGFLGGPVGVRIRHQLSQDRWRMAFTSIAQSTRTNIKILTSTEVTELNEKGPEISDEEKDTFLDGLTKAACEANFAVLSGSIPPNCGADFYCQCMNYLRDGNPDLFILLDSSGPALKNGIRSAPSAVKPNIRELSDLVGRRLENPADAAAASQTLRDDTGIEYVFCSLGEQGMVLAEKRGAYYVKAPAVEPVQTVGCGDSAVAGFLAGWKQGLELEECLRWAVSAGTAASLQTDIGLNSIGDFHEILNQTIIEQLV